MVYKIKNCEIYTCCSIDVRKKTVNRQLNHQFKKKRGKNERNRIEEAIMKGDKLTEAPKSREEGGFVIVRYVNHSATSL